MAQLQPGPCALSLDSGLSAEHSGSRTPILPVKLQASDRERGPGGSRAAFLPAASDWLVVRSPSTTCFFASSLSPAAPLHSLEHVPSHGALPVLEPQDQGSAVSSSHPNESENSWTLCLLLMRSLSSRTRAQAGTTDRTGQCDLTCEKIRKCNPAGNHRSRNSFPNERTSTLWKAVSHTLTVFLDGKSHANTAADVLKKMCVGFLQSTITASFALSCQKLSIR